MRMQVAGSALGVVALAVCAAGIVVSGNALGTDSAAPLAASGRVVARPVVGFIWRPKDQAPDGFAGCMWWKHKQ